MNKSDSSPEGKSVFRRKNFFVKKQMQIHFAITCFVLLTASTLAVWSLMHLVHNVYVNDQLQFAPGGESFIRNMNYMILFFILADAVGIFLLSIFFSHYIAGPIYRLEKALNELIETGTARPILLRKNDLLKETAALVNLLIEKSK